MIFKAFMILPLVLYIIYCQISISSWGQNVRGSWQETVYHEHRLEKVKDAIKRYSRAANVEIGPIEIKHFKQVVAAEHSLVNSTVSDSTNFKYGY